MIQRKVGSNNNTDTLTGPAGVEHTQTNMSGEIRPENNSLVNPGEEVRLQEIRETTPKSKFIPRKIQLNRKNTEAASGPPPSRRRSIEYTFNSLEELNVSFQRLEVTPIMDVRICEKREEPLLYPQQEQTMKDSNILNNLSVPQT
jgi:hypothetical protein